MPIVQIAGGLVLAHTGWGLLSEENSQDTAKPAITLETAMENAFYPLTLPLTVGPGCISVAITIGGHIRQLGGERYFFRLPLFLGALASMFAICILVWLCYGRAGRMVRRLGPTGTIIVIRLSSFIVLAIGVQIMWNGLSSAIRLLFGNHLGAS